MSDADALLVLMFARNPIDKGVLAQLVAPDADVPGWLQQQCGLKPREAELYAPHLRRALAAMTPAAAA